MFPKPKSALTPNTYAYESAPLVKPTGFREYDARWLLEKEINLMGVQALGMGLGTLIREMGVKPEIVTGHDFRSYSASVKTGAGHRPDGGGLQGARHRARDHADGLFRAVRARRALRRHGHRLAQRQRLDRREDGRQPAAHLRAGRDDAAEGDRARRASSICKGGGSYVFVENFPDALHRRPHQAAEAQAQAQGGRAPAATAPPAPSRRRCWQAIGCEVVPLDCELDHTFPRYNPNTEDMKMLHAMRDAVLAQQGRRGARLRRRRRPLRRGRQRGRGDLRRQGRRDAGARHVERCTRARPSWST